MWIMTKSDWPVLINLNRSAHIGYQQIAKFDPRTRVVASMWEQEFVLADCADGDEARAIMDLISREIARNADLLDLRGIDRAKTGTSGETNRQ